LKDSRIEIEGIEHGEVKQLLHKFLHQRGLTGYKVHSQSGVIEVVSPHDEKEETRKMPEGRPPTAPETMPYFFPGRATGHRTTAHFPSPYPSVSIWPTRPFGRRCGSLLKVLMYQALARFS
jgi:hypothetical protein